MRHRRVFLVMLAGLSVLAAGTNAPASKISFSDRDIIMQIQTKLNEAGFDAGIPDGVAGAKTKQAVHDYREKKGLAEGDLIDAELFNSLMLQDEEKEFVQAVTDSMSGILEPGEAPGDVTLFQFDLCVSVSPGAAASADADAASERAAGLSDSLTGMITEMEDYDYLWDTVTLCYADLPEIVSKKNDGAGVSPGVRRMLDDYEEFINEYCDFLDIYDEENFTHQTQYLSLMRKYAEYTEEVSSLDQSEMSDTDLKYYENVMERTEKRMEAVPEGVLP